MCVGGVGGVGVSVWVCGCVCVCVCVCVSVCAAANVILYFIDDFIKKCFSYDMPLTLKNNPLVYSGVKERPFRASLRANRMGRYLKCSLGKYICRDKYSTENETVGRQLCFLTSRCSKLLYISNVTVCM
jgi:hypothetical protein